MRTFDSTERGFPAHAPDLGDMLLSTLAIGTSLTNVFTIADLEPGDYYWNAALWVVHVGTPTSFTTTPGFTGSTGSVGFACERYTASAVATSLHNSFVATPSSVFILGKLTGYFRSTTLGNLTLGCTRTGGTSSTLQIASKIEVYQVR